jgi:hypothetical protein
LWALPSSALAGASLGQAVLIAMQKSRGVAVHCDEEAQFDAAISMMEALVLV